MARSINMQVPVDRDVVSIAQGKRIVVGTARVYPDGEITVQLLAIPLSGYLEIPVPSKEK